MKKIKCILLVLIVYFLSPSLQNVRHGERPEYLHIYTGDNDNDGTLQKPKSIILDGNEASDYLTRIKRSNSESAKEKRDSNDNSKKNSDGELAKSSTTASEKNGAFLPSSLLTTDNTTTPNSYTTSHEVNTYGNITVMVCYLE